MCLATGSPLKQVLNVVISGSKVACVVPLCPYNKRIPGATTHCCFTNILVCNTMYSMMLRACVHKNNTCPCRERKRQDSTPSHCPRVQLSLRAESMWYLPLHAQHVQLLTVYYHVMIPTYQHAILNTNMIVLRPVPLVHTAFNAAAVIEPTYYRYHTPAKPSHNININHATGSWQEPSWQEVRYYCCTADAKPSETAVVIS